MTYAGLTTADKGALLDAKARGAEWIIRNITRDVYGYKEEPMVINHRITTNRGAELPIFIGTIKDVPFIVSSEKLNIDLALAQIAEMESAEKPSTPTPLTWNERINQMTLEEKAKHFVMKKWVGGGSCYIAIDNSVYDRRRSAENRNKRILASPYTEGEKK